MMKSNSCRKSCSVSRLFFLLVFVSIFLAIYISLHYLTVNTKSFHVEIRQSEIYSQRRARVADSCQRRPTTQIDRIFYSRKYGLCYCGVAKVGCTFWKQVIRFLNNDTVDGKEYSHPLDIPRSLVHWKCKETTETYFKGKEEQFSKYDRFMFVRDPYSRLLSAYIDKVYLPDLWFYHMDHNDRFSPNVYCPLNTTFEESLQWALDRPLELMNSHWTPMYFSCDPCEFKPQFIGKQETFSQDARYILSRHNLSWILDKRSDDHSETEVKMLVRYNFGLLSDRLTARCIDGKELAVRLWRAFQINGHLSSDELYPLSDVNTVTEEMFTAAVFEALNRQTKSSSELKEQRFMFMVQAYRGLSHGTLAAIREKYALDFEMFGYDPYNPDIFSTS